MDMKRGLLTCCRFYGVVREVNVFGDFHVIVVLVVVREHPIVENWDPVWWSAVSRRRTGEVACRKGRTGLSPSIRCWHFHQFSYCKFFIPPSSLLPAGLICGVLECRRLSCWVVWLYWGVCVLSGRCINRVTFLNLAQVISELVLLMTLGGFIYVLWHYLIHISYVLASAVDLCLVSRMVVCCSCCLTRLTRIIFVAAQFVTIN